MNSHDTIMPLSVIGFDAVLYNALAGLIISNPLLIIERII